MAQLTSKIGLDAILGMGVYVGTVLAGLLILLSLYLILIYLFTRQRPVSFLLSTRNALLLAAKLMNRWMVKTELLQAT